MLSWKYIVSNVLRLPFHQDLKVEKSAICHPAKEGFVKSLGEFQGQIADYRKRLSDGRSIHVREYSTHYLIHWDKVDPSNPIGHLIEDAPHWIFISVIVLLGFIGILSWLRESKEKK